MFDLAGFFVFSVITFFSVIHALGMWFVVLLIHGILVNVLGNEVVHLPLSCGLALSAVLLIRKQWNGLYIKYINLTLVLLMIMLISALIGLNQLHSINEVVSYSKGMLLALILGGCIKTEDNIRKLTIYCIIGLLIGAFYSIYQYITGNYAIVTIYEQRAAGLREDPNDTAMLLVSGVSLAVYWFFNVRSYFKKLLLICALFAIVFAIFLTGSRGGFVTLVLIAGFLYVRKISIQSTLAGIVIVIGLMLIVPKTFVERMETLKTGKELHGGHSMDNRMELQRKGFEIFFDNLILGVGPGNFGLAFAQKKLNGNVGIRGNSAGSDDFEHNFGVAHDMHLEVFVETGIFGGILFELILVSALINLLKYDGYTRLKKSDYSLGYCLALSLFGLYFAGLFLSQGKNSVMWFMTGIGFASHSLLNNVKLKSKKGS